MALPQRTLTGVITLGLVALTTSLAVGVYSAGVAQSLIDAAPLPGLLAGHIVLMYIGVRLSVRGIVRGVTIPGIGVKLSRLVVEYLGIFILVALYAVMGGVALEVLGVMGQQAFIAMILGSVLYFAVVIAYGYKSRQKFSTWEAKAMLTAVSTIMLAIAGSLISIIYIGAIITFFLIMLLEVLYVVGRTKQAGGRPDHLRDGGRLYTVIVGFPITLLRSASRLFLRGNRR